MASTSTSTVARPRIALLWHQVEDESKARRSRLDGVFRALNAIGAVAGGAGTVLATKGKEVEIPSGTVVSVLVQDPITVRVAVK